MFNVSDVDTSLRSRYVRVFYIITLGKCVDLTLMTLEQCVTFLVFDTFYSSRTWFRWPGIFSETVV